MNVNRRATQAAGNLGKKDFFRSSFTKANLRYFSNEISHVSSLGRDLSATDCIQRRIKPLIATSHEDNLTSLDNPDIAAHRFYTREAQ